MIATLTTKGQVTIPRPVRDALRLQAGSQIQFELDDDSSTCQIERLHKPITRLAGALHYDGPPKTLAEMDQAIAEAAAQGLT